MNTSQKYRDHAGDNNDHDADDSQHEEEFFDEEADQSMNHSHHQASPLHETLKTVAGVAGNILEWYESHVTFVATEKQ